ncbi:3-dehydroquinate dehydratase [Paenibacillus odorifer]|uniref:3-dehydroquinate dehydratase n=1 Tax=Paenibacillus odorifer TaxID=189426 RepID=A0ABX3GM53_9BACL|nr:MULTISPECIES: type I 3-dehydroquinate dehydratase [Paenibacillus]MDH6430071.1 3-dehydroquinate dehydratase-1 [Paenibacillus sp. PastH-4]MDH6446284.1 3-dehydroquinate dehydratase-1 [Paenibacillus sp. PastF-4]MDH6530248.1 3-dehydroquinate dehydratase-1 [Paenibacillus sp. PastH-3]OMC67027.1 3-dehydroquinate dehydratase [Paenibacillus odorifer]OMC68246.1 3-dehydroquinate dehydratase [Paenibacillus odorifer]
MSRTVTVKNVIIGEGIPKICVPLIGATLSELKQEAEALKVLQPDLVEWRTDFFAEVEDVAAVKNALSEICSVIPDLPLIFTFRSAKEGGEKQVSTEYYTALNKAAAESGLVDIIDVELFNDEQDVKLLVEAAHAHNVSVIISNHDFQGTPPKEEIISRLCKAQELGGDLPKIAVMPQDAGDVLTLLEATHIMKEKYADRPIITMSMAGAGVISRLAGEVFGSALTFGAAHKPSAPGQVAVAELRNTLSLLHRSL